MPNRPESTPPTTLKKIVSGANWGMLAGFWVELPLMAAFLFKPFKPKDLAGWAKVSELSVKLVLPSTLIGMIYGFTKPARDFARQQKAAPPAELPPPAEPADASPHGAWAKRVMEHDENDSHIQL